MRAAGAVDDERGPANGAEGADGAVHSADENFFRPGEELRGTRTRFLLRPIGVVRSSRWSSRHSSNSRVHSRQSGAKNTLEPGETPAAERPTQFAPGFGSYRRVPTVGCRLRILSNDSTSERYLSRGKSG